MQFRAFPGTQSHQLDSCRAGEHPLPPHEHFLFIFFFFLFSKRFDF